MFDNLAADVVKFDFDRGVGGVFHAQAKLNESREIPQTDLEIARNGENLSWRLALDQLSSQDLIYNELFVQIGDMGFFNLRIPIKYVSC